MKDSIRRITLCGITGTCGLPRLHALHDMACSKGYRYDEDNTQKFALHTHIHPAPIATQSDYSRNMAITDILMGPLLNVSNLELKQK